MTCLGNVISLDKLKYLKLDRWLGLKNRRGVFRNIRKNITESHESPFSFITQRTIRYFVIEVVDFEV